MEAQNLNQNLNSTNKTEEINIGTTDDIDSIISGEDLFDTENLADELISSEPEVTVSGEEAAEPPSAESQEEVLFTDKDTGYDELSAEETIVEDKETEKIVEEKIKEETEKYGAPPTESAEPAKADTGESSFFASEEKEEEPISLSQDELSNIIEDVEGEPSTQDIISEEPAPTGVDLEAGEVKAEQPPAPVAESVEEPVTELSSEKPEELESIEEREPTVESKEEPAAETPVEKAEELEPVEETVPAEEVSEIGVEEIEELGAASEEAAIPTEEIKPEEVPETPPTEAEGPKPEETKKEESFFEELEDESISLSGDELDNILKTAEVVETPQEAEPASTEAETTPLEEEVTAPSLEETAPAAEVAEVSAEEIPSAEAEPIPEISAEEKAEEEIPSALTEEPAPSVETATAPAETLEPPSEAGVETEPSAPAVEETPVVEEISEMPSPLEAEPEVKEEEVKPTTVPPVEESAREEVADEDLKKLIKYLDSLLEKLPDDVIKEFAESEYYDLYNKILEKFGI